MQLSKDEWCRAAELSAAAEDGRRRSRWLKFQRFGAAPVGVLVATGALGLGAWWLFSHLIAPLFSGSAPHLSGHLSIGFMVVFLLAILLTVGVFRVRYLSTALLIARAMIVSFLWLGLIAYALASLV